MQRGNNKTKKSGCYACKYSKSETLHGRQEIRCLLDNMLVMRPSKGCTERKIMTNADRIRQMTDEDISDILCFADCETGKVKCPAINNQHCSGDCCGHFLRWLKQGAKNDAESNTE